MLTRLTRIIVLLLVLWCLPTVANAQPPAPLDGCALADLNQSLGDLLQQISAQQAAISAGDLDGARAALFTLLARANAQAQACSALAFEGSGAQVIGPVTIPAGVYRVRGEFVGVSGVRVERLSGECGVTYGATTPLVSSPTSDGGTDETVFRSQGCEALLEVDSTRGTWRFAFARIGGAEGAAGG